jgi:transposase
MSEEEVRRAGILGRVESGELKQREAAELLGVGERQVKRLCARYRQGGAVGLVHGNAGKRSNRAKPQQMRKRVIELLRKHYGGGPGERFGPTLAAEHLAEEHSLEMDSETLRRWMLSEGLWTRERKRKRYRQRRRRRMHFGELLQLDGSFHEWLEDRGPKGCLLNLVDDATGTAMACFANDETTWAVADVLRAWVERYGVPRAIYTDWKSVYHAPPEKGRGGAAAQPVWPHVRSTEHSLDCGELAPGQRPRGAASWHTPRPPGEEDAPTGNRRL